jgi:glycosyltransferase involved in cell wall biosynthesis
MAKKNVLEQSPHLSIVIPALNEAERLPETLKQIAAFVESRDFLTEMIVVDNGSIDAKGDYHDYCAVSSSSITISNPHPKRGSGKNGYVGRQGTTCLSRDAIRSAGRRVINSFSPQAG